MRGYAPQPGGELFAQSRACFVEIEGWLSGTEAAALTHAELELTHAELELTHAELELTHAELEESPVEGACRHLVKDRMHLVKDRMDITGARWGLDGAEAILKLRALIASSDFDEYWPYHLRQEHQRVRHSRYCHVA
jgi:hypothetical protein